jgi:nicotinate (nicotinamide) nucleotide adenylyltransferase
MEFFRRAAGSPRRVGILAGAFNPVTVAHIALARATLSQVGPQAVDEVVFVLPRVFPHKLYHGAPFAARVEMLRAALADGPSFSIAAVNGGLFIEIAAECREVYGLDTRLTFLCGRDAAERILNWDYGDPDAAAKMVREFDLLVAARGGNFEPAPKIRHSVEILALSGEFDHVSSTEVRERIARGLPWEHLTPDGARELIGQVYGSPQLGEDGSA